MYFVDRVSATAHADHDAYGIVLSTNATAKTLAHEIGHAFGCADIFHFKKGRPPLALPGQMAEESHLPLDWNNGEGIRYYSVATLQSDLICRMLMCGFDYLQAIDITSGSAYGYTKHGEPGLVDIGFFRSGARRTIRFHR